MIFEDMDRIVFAGDSVTDMDSAQPVGEGLFENVGRSYVRIIENMLAAYYPEVITNILSHDHSKYEEFCLHLRSCRHTHIGYMGY